MLTGHSPQQGWDLLPHKQSLPAVAERSTRKNTGGGLVRRAWQAHSLECRESITTQRQHRAGACHQQSSSGGVHATQRPLFRRTETFRSSVDEPGRSPASTASRSTLRAGRWNCRKGIALHVPIRRKAAAVTVRETLSGPYIFTEPHCSTDRHSFSLLDRQLKERRDRVEEHHGEKPQLPRHPIFNVMGKSADGEWFQKERAR